MAMPEKGIPSIKTTDGPNGARGEFFTNGTPVSYSLWYNDGCKLTTQGRIISMRYFHGVHMECGYDGGDWPNPRR
jgi:hypothetical protein